MHAPRQWQTLATPLWRDHSGKALRPSPLPLQWHGPLNYHGLMKDEISIEDNENLNKSFFLKLRTEIQTAKLSNKLICIQMDANSKVGDDIIKNNPVKNISENGKLLMENQL